MVALNDDDGLDVALGYYGFNGFLNLRVDILELP